GWNYEKRESGRPAVSAACRRDSEVLLVADVGDGALVLVRTAARERVLATRHDVLGANRELAAPRSAPRQADAQTFPLTRIIRSIDHASDNVRAEVADTGTDGDGAAAPAVGECRDVASRNQPRARPGAADRHRGFVPDVLLAIDGQGVLVELAGLAVGAQPGRHAVAALADRQREPGAGAADAGTDAGLLAAVGTLSILLQRGEQAVVGEVADGAGQAGLAVAHQPERVAGLKAERRIKRGPTDPPAGTGGRVAGRLEQQYRLELAAGVVPYRQDGGVPMGRCLAVLRVRARRHAKGEEQG